MCHVFCAFSSWWWSGKTNKPSTNNVFRNILELDIFLYCWPGLSFPLVHILLIRFFHRFALFLSKQNQSTPTSSEVPLLDHPSSFSINEIQCPLEVSVSGLISSCFRPRLSLYLEYEAQNITHMLEKIAQNEVCVYYIVESIFIMNRFHNRARIGYSYIICLSPLQAKCFELQLVWLQYVTTLHTFYPLRPAMAAYRNVCHTTRWWSICRRFRLVFSDKPL